MHADYNLVKTVLECVDVSAIAKNAGLNDDAYLRLMEAPFLDECLHIVLLGLKNLSDREF